MTDGELDEVDADAVHDAATPAVLPVGRIDEIVLYATRKPVRMLGLHVWRCGGPAGGDRSLLPDGVFNRLADGVHSDTTTCYATEADAMAAFREAWRAWKESQPEGNE